MDVLASHEGVALLSAHVMPRNPPTGLPEGTPFVCLLWNHTGGVPEDWISTLVRALLHGGCEYFACAGVDAENVSDLVDRALTLPPQEGSRREKEEADVASWSPGTLPVMTNWHVNESVEDVLLFFLTGTADEEGGGGANFLILHIGEGPERRSIDRVAKDLFVRQLHEETEDED